MSERYFGSLIILLEGNKIMLGYISTLSCMKHNLIADVVMKPS